MKKTKRVRKLKTFFYQDLMLKFNRTREAQGIRVPHAVGRGVTVAEKVLHIKYVGGFA